ncbi:hypothetical protein DL95DRAFT_507835 [Leptodontidium sp. 2 PMI_412]|nr:hypothetical protein DL95DRAFT_507835 [Leptodontidium sp. 2 PMI_412]
MDVENTRIVACERCSRRKQRCDRKLPACSQCLQANADCRDGRGESVMTRSAVGAVQPKGFVELLEGRLQQLQMLARDHDISIQDQVASPNQVRGEGGRDDIEGSRIERHVQFDPAHRPNSTEGRSRRHSPEIGLLSLRAMAEPSSRATEFLKGISMPGIISAVTETYGGNPQRTTGMDALWDGIAKDIRQSVSDEPDRLVLPAEDGLKYVDTYFEVVDYRYPQLPKAEVMRGILAITASDPADYASSLLQEPATIFMAYMVLAITPLVSDTYPVAQASFISIHILSKALKILDKVFQHEDGVDIIYCLILLVIFSFHSSAAGSSWQLTGIAMKKCIALGFHREVAKPRRDTSDEDLEQRRWAFWSCYFLDRYGYPYTFQAPAKVYSLVSSALDRPFSINDTDITIEVSDAELACYNRLSF